MASTVLVFLPLAAGTAAAANPTGGNYVPLTPTRLADTRCGESPAVGGSNCTAESIPTANAAVKTVPAGGTIVVTASGVPSGAAAASLSVTAVDGTAPGFLTVFPDGTSLPLESSVNYVAGTPACTTVDCIAPNLTITPLSSADKFDVYNGGAGSVDVVVDLEGYFNAPSATTGGAGHYFPLTPSRVGDTRCGDTPPG
ncbi:MAG: hypothetical protein ACRDYC_02725, partial [Acidimicrobiales bacterium]